MTDTQTLDLLQAKIQMINDVAKIFSQGNDQDISSTEMGKKEYFSCYEDA